MSIYAYHTLTHSWELVKWWFVLLALRWGQLIGIFIHNTLFLWISLLQYTMLIDGLEQLAGNCLNLNKEHCTLHHYFTIKATNGLFPVYIIIHLAVTRSAMDWIQCSLIMNCKIIICCYSVCSSSHLRFVMYYFVHDSNPSFRLCLTQVCRL